MADLNETDFNELNISEDNGPTPGPEYHKKKIKRVRGSKLWLWLLVVLVIAGLELAGWKLLVGPEKPAPTASVTPAPKTESSANSDTPDTTTTKKYNSDTYNLSLNYPSDWILTTAADGSIKIVSPTFNYKTVNGQNIIGNFRVSLRQTARPVDSKYIGRGVSVGPSQSLTYSKPATTQRQTTYLTNFGLDTADNFAYFFIAGNFNLNKDDTLGPNYGTEAGTDIISGGYSSATLTEDMATYQVPLSFYSRTNAYRQAVEIIKSLQIR